MLILQKVSWNVLLRSFFTLSNKICFLCRILYWYHTGLEQLLIFFNYYYDYNYIWAFTVTIIITLKSKSSITVINARLLFNCNYNCICDFAITITSKVVINCTITITSIFRTMLVNYELVVQNDFKSLYIWFLV